MPAIIVLVYSLALCVIAGSCGNVPDQNSSSSLETHNSTISLAPFDEPGQRLVLSGSVIDSQTGEPISQAQVYLYHADANGQYQPSNPQDESTARLSGEVITNVDGKFTVSTIVPREYDQPGNRHIHLHSARADGYQDSGGVILFEQDVNAEIRQWALDIGFGTIIELEEIDGVQHGNVEIQLHPKQ